MLAEVQLIAGPARCGKTKHLVQIYRERLEACQTGGLAVPLGECFWLAPNQTAATEFQHRLFASAPGALLRPNVCTFARFADTLIARSQRRIRPISLPQKRRLVGQAIKSKLASGQLEHFARVASTPGFVIQVEEFIAELKRKDIWSEDFERRARSDRRNRELAGIYSSYQQLLHRGELYDAEGRFWAAREILTKPQSNTSQPNAAGNSQRPFDLVVINGFNDFTIAQYDILRLLGERSNRLMISLTVELEDSECVAAEQESGDSPTMLSEGVLSFAKTQQTLTSLREVFPQLQVNALPALPADGRNLSGLQKEVFRDLPKMPSEQVHPEDEGSNLERDRSTADVEIVAANSAIGEVEAIAQRIKTLLLCQQAQPQEIAVVCQGGESMTELIAAVFPDYGIPYASELRPRLETEPLSRSLSTLLRLHQEDWPFQTLLDVINNQQLTRLDVGLNLAASFAVRPRVALEYCVRSAQLPSGKLALLEQLEYRHNLIIQGEEVDRRGAQVAVALEGLRTIEKLLANLPNLATINTWLQAFEQLLSQLGVLASPCPRSGRVWQLLRKSLHSISQIDAWSMSEEPLLTLSDMRDLLATVAHSQRLPARHDSVGRVRILTAESARKLTVPHLFVAGLSEQAFASTATTEQPLAEDAEPLPSSPPDDLPESLVKTNAPQSVPAASSTLFHGDGMLLFYELVTRATESLTLSYPAIDAKGQTLPPSPLLTELERSSGSACIVRSTLALDDPLAQGSTPLSQSSFRRQAVQQALDGKNDWLAGMLSHPDFVRQGSSILSGIDCVAQRSMRGIFGSYEGLVLSKKSQAALAQHFDTKHLWSPSQLESYAACPFRFFSEHLLHLEPLSDLTLSNDARRRGSLLHQVLATIHQELSQLIADDPADDIDTLDLVQRFLAALNAAVEATPLRGIEEALREIERREIEAWAPEYAQQESNYRRQWKHLDLPPQPAFFEVRFGPDTRGSQDASDPASTAEPFALDLGDEHICLTGQIDRVDIGEVGGVKVFNIIDYKSGQGVKLKLEKVRSGLQLQLPLYAMAAEQLLLADQEAVTLATGYWNIQGKGFETAKGGVLHMRELADQALRTSKDWQQLQPDILVRVQQLIDAIRGGQFPVYNEDQQCTRSCSLSTVCRVAQVRSLEKVWPPVENQDSETGQDSEAEVDHGR